MPTAMTMSQGRGAKVLLAVSTITGKAPWLIKASPTSIENQPAKPAKRLASWQELLLGWGCVSPDQPPSTVQGLPARDQAMPEGKESPVPAHSQLPQKISEPFTREGLAPPELLPICTLLAAACPQWHSLRNPMPGTSLVLGELGLWGDRHLSL